MDILTAAWADIDAVTDLPDLLREAGTSVNSTQLALPRLEPHGAVARARLVPD